MEKGPWDTDVMQGIICVLQRNTVIPLKKLIWFYQLSDNVNCPP